MIERARIVSNARILGKSLTPSGKSASAFARIQPVWSWHLPCYLEDGVRRFEPHEDVGKPSIRAIFSRARFFV